MFKTLWEGIKKIIKEDLIYIIIIIALFIFCSTSINSCSNLKQENTNLENNITALVDSIKYKESKNGELVAEKTILTGEVKELKKLNSDLYNDLVDMKSKNADLAAKLDGYISIPKVDTIFIYNKDSIFIENEINQPFKFEDQYHILAGSIKLKENTIGLNVDTNTVFFDYTISIEDEIIKIKSDNPYVQYDNIISIKKPKEKPKRWNVGVQAGFGFSYDILNKNLGIGPYIGVGIAYGFSF